jgi:hypothetical protein
MEMSSHRPSVVSQSCIDYLSIEMVQHARDHTDGLYLDFFTCPVCLSRASYVCTHVFVCVCVHMYVSVCICMCLCRSMCE